MSRDDRDDKDSADPMREVNRDMVIGELQE